MSSKATLLAIPPKVRLRIYHFVFEHSEVRIHSYMCRTKGTYPPPFQTSSDVAGPDGRRPRNTDLRSFPASITQTCKLVRSEPARLLVAATSFRLCAPSTNVLDVHIAEFFNSLATDFLQQIRHIFVDWNLLEYLPIDIFASLEILEIMDNVCYLREVTEETMMKTTDETLVKTAKDNLGMQMEQLCDVSTKTML